MSPNNAYQITIARTAELLGGMDKLRAELQVPLADLQRWNQGYEKPPADVLLRVVQLLIERTQRPTKSRAGS
jgi:hypothetical protein